MAAGPANKNVRSNLEEVKIARNCMVGFRLNATFRASKQGSMGLRHESGCGCGDGALW